MCKSQQVNEIAEKSTSSDEECNLIQSFDSCEEFVIMAIESELSSMEELDEYIKQQSNRNRDIKKSSKDIQKVDIRPKYPIETNKVIKSFGENRSSNHKPYY